MGNNITKRETKESKGWWCEMIEGVTRHEDDTRRMRENWERWANRCKYITEVRATWKHETSLLPRLRRLGEEDLDEIRELIDCGRSFNEDCSQKTLEIFPALELYLLVKRDMKERLARQPCPSPSSSSNNGDKDSSIIISMEQETASSLSTGPIERRKMGSLLMLPELKAWLYSPGDSTGEFRKRLKLWSEALEIYEREMSRACACSEGQI